MKQTYGLNWLEVTRRLVGGLISLGMIGTFGWFLTHIQLGLNGETILCVVMLLLFVFAGGWVLQTVLLTLWQNPRFQLREGGVTLITNDHEMDWDWDEFTDWSGKLVYHKMYRVFTMYISGGCEFLSNQKPPLVVGSLVQDAPKLAGIIITQAVKVQLPAQLEAFRQGKTLEFGIVTLDKTGLQYGGALIPLNEIKGLSRNRYFFMINRKGQTIRITETKVQRLELLMAVVQTILRPSQ